MLARCHHLETVWRVVLDASPGRDVALLDGPGLAQLDAILAAASNHDGLRVLVLESRAPGSFCAGMDLQGLSGAASDPGAAMAAYASCLRRLRALRGVVVAVVDGAAVGGGVGLAAAADIALASERASFALPELTWGLMPAMVLPVLREGAKFQMAEALYGIAGYYCDEAILDSHHVFDPSVPELRMYRDGLLVKTTPTSYSTLAYGDVGVVMGRHSYFYNRYLDADVDEVAVWNQALTDAAILEVYRVGLNGQPIPTAAPL